MLFLYGNNRLFYPIICFSGTFPVEIAGVDKMGAKPVKMNHNLYLYAGVKPRDFTRLAHDLGG